MTLTDRHSALLAQTSEYFQGEVVATYDSWVQLQAWAVEYGLRAIGASLTFIIGWTLARWLSRGVTKWLRHAKHVDNTVADYAGSFIRLAILTITCIAVLAKFGVETASFVGVISAASLAIGLALQGTLSNFAAGLMLLLFRPFKESDVVELSGKVGTVRAVGIFATEIRPASGEFLLIPNSQVWGTTILNLTRNGARRFELLIGIDYSANHLEAQERMLIIANAHPNVLPSPAPVASLRELGDNAVVIGLNAWTRSGNMVGTQRAILSEIKLDFDQHGIGFPFPQRDVNLITSGPIPLEIIQNAPSA